MALAEISTALASVKTVTEIAKGILSLNKDVAVNEKAAELISTILLLQRDLISLQSDYADLLKTKENLLEELKQFNTWAKIESLYKLEEVSNGKYVYAPIDKELKNEPLHWLCSNCWEDKRKSIYQMTYDGANHKTFTCPRCKNEFQIQNGERGPALGRSPRRSGYDPLNW
ncbi:MAG: hypothetical protein ACYC09_14055 [Bacteroidota bacterium]